MRAEGVRAVSPNGVLGDPARASAEHGRALLAAEEERIDAYGARMASVALVTGAARGIGAATVAGLAAAGWTVVAVDVCADDPRLPYPMATRAELDAVAGADRRPGGRRRRHRRRGDGAPWSPTPSAATADWTRSSPARA